MQKNTFYDYITTKQTVPASTLVSGTISTVGTKVKGVGTKFKTEMPAGSWLVDLTQNYIAKVFRVNSDTSAHLYDFFPIDIPAGTTPNVIGLKKLGLVGISVLISSGSTSGFIDGKTLPVGQATTFSKDSRDSSAYKDFVDPIIVDPNGANVTVIIMR